MDSSDAGGVCPPHHWEVTSIRINGIIHYHHHCKKCCAEKDIPFTASSATRWISRKPPSVK